MPNKFADFTLEQLAGIDAQDGSTNATQVRVEMEKRSIISQIEATQAQKRAAFWMQQSVFVMAFATLVNVAVSIFT